MSILNIVRGQAQVSEIELKRALAYKNAIGKLRDGIKYRVSGDRNHVRMIGIADVRGFPYWKVIDQGAKAPFRGIMPETPSFRQWLRARGIPLSASFPIRRKISRDGLKPTYIFTDENKKTFDDLSRKVRKEWMVEVRNTLYTEFKKI